VIAKTRALAAAIVAQLVGCGIRMLESASDGTPARPADLPTTRRGNTQAACREMARGDAAAYRELLRVDGEVEAAWRHGGV
jgi:hypothetical protein